jgi:branched-chain amino acid transport system ATP-binding protein/branched-chain amino acid transport system permease protein
MNAVANAYRAGARDARAAWSQSQTAGVLLVAAGCALPWIAPGWVHLDVLAAWLYLALAATGLGLTVGIAGLPSLGQGAFMSIGAFTTALLAARAGWSADAAIPAAVAASLVAGLLAGLVVVRQPPLFLAVSTWILSWLVLLVAVEFPGVSGGSQGYVVPSSLSTTGHYELALVLTAAAVAALSVLRRSSPGLRLRATRDRPAAATGLGVPGRRVVLGAFAASAAVGGLAGSLAVQLAGVSDPNAFGPFTSFKLLAAILLGGASYACAGVVGVAILGAVALVGHAWAVIQGDAPAQLQPMLASLLLLAILGVGGDGLIPLLLRLRGRVAREPGPEIAPLSHEPGEPAALRAGEPAALRARGLRKHYGGLHALDGLDLEVGAGETVALVGANGSGKTTALQALAGALPLDAGEIALDGRPLEAVGPERLAQAGVVRTLQRTATFGSLTALENAIVGAGLRARHGGTLRSLVATPKARAEARTTRRVAMEALRTVNLEAHAHTRAELLDGFQQRLLMLAAALATRPRLLLLDEPSAGATATEVANLAAILADVRASGVSLVLVEHNLQLVRAVADRVVVMADGKAEGGVS